MSINTIDLYIATFDENTQLILQQLRQQIKAAAPAATETINYGMPTFVLEGNLVHFAAYKKHIGFYPAPSGIEKFKEQLLNYTTSKGAIQFPIDKPLPFKLITQIVKFRVLENTEKAALKKLKRRCKNGHQFIKTSDCPTCPICEKEANKNSGLMSILGAPARRALQNAGISTIKELSQKSEMELLTLHGFGPSSLPKLRQLLKNAGLSFKK